MTAFDIAMRTLFSDQNLRETAVYMSQLGESKEVFVIMHKPGIFPSIGTSFVAAATAILDVMVADCPNLSAGDRFLVAGTTYTVQGQPKRDGISSTWRVDLRE